MMVPRLRASPRHGGAGGFIGIFSVKDFVLIRRGGVPSGAAAFILHGEIQLSYDGCFSMKLISFYEDSTSQGLSEVRWGGEDSRDFFSVNDVVNDPPRGRPVGGGGVHHTS